MSEKGVDGPKMCTGARKCVVSCCRAQEQLIVVDNVLGRVEGSRTCCSVKNELRGLEIIEWVRKHVVAFGNRLGGLVINENE